MENVAKKLDNINHTLEKMLAVMQRPENRFIRALEIFVLFAGALSILSAVDVVRHWIIGG